MSKCWAENKDLVIRLSQAIGKMFYIKGSSVPSCSAA